ncbi:MAG: LON peptidase substrate-binding domain-containing protein, partial [Muribaculaceae bacterium]|nr:LON peptidase substrate-binding domain-containing protein [Muribaculaceae bacterium]
MQKIKHRLMNSPKPDIQVSGSIIAEFPTDEDAKTFNFGKEIPILPLRNVVAFPGMPVPVPLTNENDVKIAEELYNSHSCVLAIPTKSPDSEANRLRDFYPYGTVCKIGKVLKMPEMDPVVFLLGGPRARLKKIISKKPVVTGEITVGAELVIEDNYETDYLMENIKSSFDKLLSFVPDHEKQRVSFEVEDIADQPVASVFFMICNSPLSHEEKAQLLGAKNFKILLENFVLY